MVTSLYRWTGLLALRELRRQGAAVLAYHGIVPEIRHPGLEQYAVDVGTFRDHMRFLKRRLAPISMSTLIEAMHTGGAIDPRWVVVTFDDGLRNQVGRGFDVLREMAIPGALFAPPGLIETGRSLWSYEVSFLVIECWRLTEIPFPDGRRSDLPTRTREQKVAASTRIKEFLMCHTPEAERKAYLDGLIAAVGAQEFAERLEAYGEFTLATWEELLAAQAKGLDIHAHGHRHLPHNDTLDDRELTEEAESSRRLLCDRLGQPPQGYALPGGVVSKRALQSVSAAGYTFLVTSDTGTVTSATDPMQLPRMNAEYPLTVLRRHMLSAPLTRAGGPNSPQQVLS